MGLQMGAKAETACSTQTEQNQRLLHPGEGGGSPPLTLYLPGFLRAQTRAPWPPMEWPLMEILLGSLGKLALMSLGSWETHRSGGGVRAGHVTKPDPRPPTPDLLRHVGVHAVVGLPGVLGGVHVKTSPRPKVPALVLPLNATAP